MSSANPNNLAQALPGAGTSFAVNGLYEIQENSIDTTCLAESLIQQTTVSLTAAQIQGMNVTPVQLIAAPGAGLTIVLHKVLFKMTTTATQFANGGTVVVQYDSGNVAAINTIAANVVTAVAGTSKTARNGIDVTAVVNTALEITNATAPFITGTGTAQVVLWYSII